MEFCRLVQELACEGELVTTTFRSLGKDDVVLISLLEAILVLDIFSLNLFRIYDINMPMSPLTEPVILSFGDIISLTSLLTYSLNI
jgi:hypothetical protein